MRNLLLSTVTLLVVPAVAIATPDFPSHTHTTPIELESISPSLGLKLASVCFLGYGDCGDIGFGKGDGDYDIDTDQQCLNEGFSKQNCNSVQEIDGVCPYNPAYGRGCKCISNLISCPAGQIGVGDSCEGKYASCKCDPNLISCPSNKIGSGASCGGKYQSCVCKSEYQYTSLNCTSPRSVSGSSCDGKYTGCSCPVGIDDGNFGCKEYYPSPCSSVCKVAYPDNCHNRTDNNSQTYGCMKYYDDCPTKCETPYKDNCRNRTEITVPANATCSTYFADCSSKCSDWDCSSGYKLSGGSCIASSETCKIGSIYYSDGTCLSPENHISTKTVLGIVVYVTDGGKHGQVISVNCSNNSGPTNGSGGCGIAGFGTDGIDTNLNNETSFLTAAEDYDSCENTDKLLAYDGVNSAAKAARRYCPTSNTCNKWCLPAAGVLANIYRNKTEFQNALNVVMDYPGNFWVSYMWSSTEADKNNGWFSMPYGLYYGLDKSIKSAGISVRPVLEF